MKIFNFEILKSNEISEIKKELEILRQERTPQSAIDEFAATFMKSGNEGVEKREVLTKKQQYLYSITNATIGNIIQSLTIEIFRRGFELKPLFKKQCQECNTKYDYNANECENCGSTNLIKPSKEEQERLEAFIDEVNGSNQCLLDLCQELARDVNVYDDTFTVLEYNYDITSNNTIIPRLNEVYRGDPLIFKFVANKYGELGKDDKGNTLYFCFKHRDKTHAGINICPICKSKMFRAAYVLDASFSKQFYADHEVIHFSEYNPTRLYGLSPMNNIIKELEILDGIKKTMNSYYKENRPPRSYFLINAAGDSKAEEALRKATEYAKANPSAPVPLFIYSPNVKEPVKLIDVMKTPEEMQMLEFMAEIKREVGAQYGVMPIWQADNRTSGGLNNEGMQIVVTNRAIERGIKTFNEKLFPKLMAALRINDWVIQLKGVDANDELVKAQIEAQKLNNMLAVKNLGYEVDYDERSKEFNIGEKKEPEFEGPVFQEAELTKAEKKKMKSK